MSSAVDKIVELTEALTLAKVRGQQLEEELRQMREQFQQINSAKAAQVPHPATNSFNE